MQPQSHAIHYPPSLGPPHYPVASHSRNMSGEQVVNAWLFVTWSSIGYENQVISIRM